MALKPKVTVASVKRKWEEKYAELDKKYCDLAAAHLALAKKADEHRNAQENAEEKLQDALDLATERLVKIHRLRGVVAYLDCGDPEEL